MMKNLFFCLITILMLTGCADGPKSFFKRSANNKLFDMHGFEGGKRPPLYNQKYVAKAKRNISLEDLEDDEYDDEDVEFKVPSRVYKRMYSEMLAAERARRRDFNRAAPHLREYGYYDDYPDLHRASKKVSQNGAVDSNALQREMREIKSMLRQTQNELTKYKCPNATAISDESVGERKEANKKHIKTNLQRRFLDQETNKEV